MPESLRILIVDDTPQVRQGLATTLSLAARKLRPSLEVVGEAENGREAIAKAQSLNPDVILMDLEMPGMDGYEATRQIKASQPGVRVIILTIHGGVEEQEGALSAGADHFLIKGCSFEDLLAAIYEKNQQSNQSDQWRNI